MSEEARTDGLLIRDLNPHGINITPPTRQALTIMMPGVNSGEEMVSVSATGEITFGPHYHPDEAARIFWAAIGQYRADEAAAATAWRALRGPLQRFAHIMEAQLRKNDHKGGWENDSEWRLFERLLQESGELAVLLSRGEEEPFQIAREAADIANFALMIADNECFLRYFTLLTPPEVRHD